MVRYLVGSEKLFFAGNHSFWQGVEWLVFQAESLFEMDEQPHQLPLAVNWLEIRIKEVHIRWLFQASNVTSIL